MKNTFRKFNEFVNESLVILSLKGLMKNEFMNNNQLRQDYETARRIIYEKTSSLFTHIEGEDFTARTMVKIEPDQMDSVIAGINEQTKRMKFSRSGAPKKTELKEFIWKIKGSIE